MADNEDEKKADDNNEDVQYLLISAAMRGDQKDIKELLSNSEVDINAVDEKGNSALHWAAYFDELGVMKLLIADPNINLCVRSKRGNTVFHMAAVANASKSLTHLINLGTKASESLVNAQNNWGETALHLAASTGKVEAIQILCSTDLVDTTIRDNWDRTALRVAHENLETDAINILSKYCPDEVIADAAKVEESRMKLGQEVGANMDERSGVERQQMMREFMKEMQMMQHKMKETMSLDKVHVQHAFDVGGKVVEKVEVDENAQKENGGAAVIGNAKRFKYKLASKFEYGVSPKTKEELEEWLNDEEIDNDGKDLYGWSALHKVIFWQKTEFIAPLLEQMSAECINAVGPEGEAAIHMALGLVLNSQGGKAEILEMLCQCEKVDKGQQTKDGQSAMEIARKANADDVVLKMLQ